MPTDDRKSVIAAAQALVDGLDGFTPAPWHVNGPKPMEIVGRIHRILSPENYPAAFVPAWDRPEAGEVDGAEEASANAALIAAAPDLHAALADALALIAEKDAALRDMADCASWPKFSFDEVAGRARAALGDAP